MQEFKVGDLVRTPPGQEAWAGRICKVISLHGDFLKLSCPEFPGALESQMWDMGKLTLVNPAGPYRDAILAVDPGACNLSGLIRSMNRHLDLVWHEAKLAGRGTDYVNQHPAFTLFLSQMIYLNTGYDHDISTTDAYAAALAACQAKLVASAEIEVVV